MIFDKIFAEVGRSVAKKVMLVMLSIILAIVAWMAKNHIDIK